MPGIIPFFHLEDPDDIHDRIDIKHLRKRVKFIMRKSFYNTLDKKQIDIKPDSPDQLFLPLYNNR